MCNTREAVKSQHSLTPNKEEITGESNSYNACYRKLVAELGRFNELLLRNMYPWWDTGSLFGHLGLSTVVMGWSPLSRRLA